MNPDLNKLHPYPFEKLAKLKAEAEFSARGEHIALSIGEPKHPTPDFIIDTLSAHLSTLTNYPTTKGTTELRQTIADWLSQRFSLPADSLNIEQQILPVNGTREALFAFAQTVIDRSQNAIVVCPNPFYQIYEGAAFLAGATPHYVPITAENGFLADYLSVPESIWEKCQLLYLCTPNNPTGATYTVEALQALIKLADKYSFILASDECYSEIYFDENKRPAGLLQAAAAMGHNDHKNCVVFHSLSKRSNAPGLRSGFVAGDADVITQFLRYRTYHGSAMSLPVQAASIAAWRDEAHVKQNRELYREKFARVLEILSPVMTLQQPSASFYLWAKTPINDELFAQRLYAECNVTVLPGSYLSRDVDNMIPGANYVRMALVASVEECIEAAERMRDFIKRL
ncbi:MAG: succinyldiaminopimelate transaminase [Gammaproteobacteria bacterium]|nr:succinyldiaminopimelate transaminase [Gammaproteobacteria bacterium]